MLHHGRHPLQRSCRPQFKTVLVMVQSFLSGQKGHAMEQPFGGTWVRVKQGKSKQKQRFLYVRTSFHTPQPKHVVCVHCWLALQVLSKIKKQKNKKTKTTWTTPQTSARTNSKAETMSSPCQPWRSTLSPPPRSRSAGPNRRGSARRCWSNRRLNNFLPIAGTISATNSVAHRRPSATPPPRPRTRHCWRAVCFGPIQTSWRSS